MHFAISDANTLVLIILLVNVNKPLTIDAIPNVFSSFWVAVIAVVFAVISDCNPSVVDIVVYVFATLFTVSI